ncbi:hypothetical protein LSH36_143g04042 [Paralvinella palmiformis]|uniref:EF-hand domain-containing protein n=1 Tax=Paralvinella palmiformis TaxID=53620 RepID=A0AAD9JW65_9ANNE|nr:hypothetical protein LSH36_143g04042 [Paralvinella palmiformis]
MQGSYGGYGGQQGYGGPPQPGYGQQPPPAGYNAPAGGYGGTPGMAGPPGVDPQVVQWFQAVDMDRSGRITALELQQALTNTNWTHFNADTCTLMIGMFDRDYNGIDLNEFHSLWNYLQQWRGIFAQFDRDSSGFIDANELHNAFNTLGYRLSPQFSQLIVRRYDLNTRSRLSLDNFIQSCVLLKSLTDVFRQKDVQMTGQVQIGYEELLTMCMLHKP